MANQSGISEIPSLLPYPSVLKISEFDGILNMFCYVIEHYGSDGIAFMVNRNPKDDNLMIQFGDWSGNVFDLSNDEDPYVSLCKEFFESYGTKIVQLMKVAQFTQAIYYITINAGKKFKLADVRTALNKFIGPGMLRDVFGNIIEVPKVLTIENITKDVLDALERGTGKYSTDLVLKPSRFRTVKWNGIVSPLYVEIIR